MQYSARERQEYIRGAPVIGSLSAQNDVRLLQGPDTTLNAWEMPPQTQKIRARSTFEPRGKKVMTKYVTFFVVAVYLGSSIGRAETAASPGDGPRTAASHEQDNRVARKAMLAKLNAQTDAKNNPSPGDPAENPGLEREWTKAEQGFGAMLFFSDKPQQFVDDWSKPGETANVAASCSHSVARGTPCVAFIVFTGCGADKQGLADVVADISMLTPDGKVIGERKGVEICQKRPAPPDKQLQLGVGNLGMVLQPNDPLGTYEIHAKVSDRVKGVSLALKKKFSVDK